MKNKRGQITIFIVVATVIIALAFLFYTFFPNLGVGGFGQAKNPVEFVQTCIEEDLEGVMKKVSLQGGSLDPELYFKYNNENIEYLCYTNQYYETCILQQPLLKQHVEEELTKGIQDKVNECFIALKESYEGRGYQISITSGSKSVVLLPERVILELGHNVVLTKDGSETYDSFNIILVNNLYELLAIAENILEWETNLGDADPTTYMTYYQHIKVEKNLRDDGTTLYTITDRNTQDKFRFASRSVAFPSGY